MEGYAARKSTESGTHPEPPPQMSPVVQALPSSHDEVLLVETQPVAGSQESLVQELLSSQTTGTPKWHQPSAHTSPDVHALPSSHGSELLVETQPMFG